MAWETRGSSRLYYTRSRRMAGRIVRQYVGGGAIGEIAAHADRLERQFRVAQRVRKLASRDAINVEAGLVAELDNSIGLLVAAVLIGSGFRRHHRGEWRRKQEGPGAGSS